jgi:hypothetical protein
MFIRFPEDKDEERNRAPSRLFDRQAEILVLGLWTGVSRSGPAKSGSGA